MSGVCAALSHDLRRLSHTSHAGILRGVVCFSFYTYKPRKSAEKLFELKNQSAMSTLFIVDLVSTERTRVVSLLYPFLDTLGVEEVLWVTVKSGYVLLLLEVLPTDYALFLAVVEPSPELELWHWAKHIDLVIKVLKPININVKIVRYYLFKNQ